MISLYDTNINDFLIWCKNRFYNLLILFSRLVSQSKRCRSVWRSMTRRPRSDESKFFLSTTKQVKDLLPCCFVIQLRHDGRSRFCYTRSPMILMKFLNHILLCDKIQFSTIVYPPAHSRTVLAVNLPMERPTIESVAEIFSVCGEVALIRILRPGKK